MKTPRFTNVPQFEIPPKGDLLEKFLYDNKKAVKKKHNDIRNAVNNTSSLVFHKGEQAVERMLPEARRRLGDLFSEYKLLSFDEDWVEGLLDKNYAEITISQNIQDICLGASIWLAANMQISRSAVDDLVDFGSFEDYSKNVQENMPPIETPDLDRKMIASVNTIVQKRIGGNRFSYEDYSCHFDGSDMWHNKFNAMLSYVPQELINDAVLRFKDVFWTTLRVSYENAKTYNDKLDDCLVKENSLRKQYNDTIDLIHREVNRSRKEGNNTVQNGPQTYNFPAEYKIKQLIDELNRLRNSIFACDKRYHRERLNMDKAFRMIELDYPYIETDVLEMCFAFIYLMDNDDDILWVFHACEVFVRYICRNMPWRFALPSGRYTINQPIDLNLDSEFCQYWTENKYIAKSIGMEYDSSTMSLAHFACAFSNVIVSDYLYLDEESTNWALLMIEYGFSKDTVFSTIGLLNAIKRMKKINEWKTEAKQRITSGLYQDMDTLRDECTKKDETIEQLNKEIRHVRNHIRISEKCLVEAMEDLSKAEEKNASINKELAALREIIFNQDDEHNDDEVDATGLPYAVKGSILIIGGHPSWIKAIKPMLSGDVKYLGGGEFNFDTSVVKNADSIWIQTNCLSHPMYYSVIDIARANKKAVNYFTNASASKCAMAIMEENC